jgi:hypothetical protein
MPLHRIIPHFSPSERSGAHSRALAVDLEALEPLLGALN